MQDPDYSYGYADGTLVVVYDADGNVVAGDVAQRQEDIAGRYLARAEALYQASVRHQHEAVAEANWERQRERVYQDEQRWEQAQARDAAWNAYHQQQQDQEQAHWAQETLSPRIRSLPLCPCDKRHRRHRPRRARAGHRRR